MKARLSDLGFHPSSHSLFARRARCQKTTASEKGTQLSTDRTIFDPGSATRESLRLVCCGRFADCIAWLRGSLCQLTHMLSVRGIRDPAHASPFASSPSSRPLAQTSPLVVRSAHYKKSAKRALLSSNGIRAAALQPLPPFSPIPGKSSF